MTDAGFFRGTSAEQDNRFSDKEKKLLKQMRFGDNVTKRVDMSKVKLECLRAWISKRVEDLLGMEDDVIEEFVVNQLEANQYPDGRRIQINLTGFLNGKNARIFTTELWDMLLSAQEQTSGIPVAIIESKQEEIRKRNEEQEKLSESIKKTMSRFTEKLKSDRDSSPPSSSTASASKSSFSSSIKKERVSPDNSNRETDNSSRRKDDGSRRQYRARRSPSPPPRKSRSRSRSPHRDRDHRGDRRPSGVENRRDNYRDRERSARDRTPPRDRRRERSRSPVQTRRPSPPPSRDPPPRRPSGDKSRDRDRSNAVGNRRFSDYHDRDRDIRDRASIQDRRRRSPPHDESRPGRAQGQNGSQFRQPASPPRAERGHRDERVTDSLRKMEIERNTAKSKSSPENSDQSNDDSAPEDSAKKAKKEKKSKKEKKKHKKHHKKSKKSKKAKGNGSADENMDEDNGNEDDSGDSEGSEEDNPVDTSSKLGSSFRKYVESSSGGHPSDDLEKKLREKALESLKKANSSGSRSSSGYHR